jgi:hypothetical protein
MLQMMVRMAFWASLSLLTWSHRLASPANSRAAALRCRFVSEFVLSVSTAREACSTRCPHRHE